MVTDGMIRVWYRSQRCPPRLYTESIQKFEISASQQEQQFCGLCDAGVLHREDLKLKRPRMMAVLDPVKLIIDNYPENQMEELDVEMNLENPELGMKEGTVWP